MPDTIKLKKGLKENRPALQLSELTCDNDLGNERLIYGGLNRNVEFPNINDISVSMARQAIINGNFDIWQRGASFSNLATGNFTADRYYLNYDADGGSLPNTITHSKQILTPGDIPSSAIFYRITVDGAGSGLGVKALYKLEQKIENATRYLAGLSKKISISFYARSSIVNKRLGLYLTQSYGSGGNPSSEELINGGNFTLTSTWTKYTITLPLNTLVDKTFGTNSDDYISLVFTAIWGNNYNSLVGASVSEGFGSAGTIDIAQVQVNAGDIALPFSPKSFEEELIKCQRYYEKSYNLNDAPASSLIGASFRPNSDNGLFATIFYKVAKRVNPTVNVYSSSDGSLGNVSLWNGSTYTNRPAFIDLNYENSFRISATNGGITPVANYDFNYIADAEI